MGRLTRLPLTGGNRVSLMEAPAALAAMIEAVDQARDSVFLATYIFGNDAAGRPLADALVRAHRRGVQVRVLVDGVGALYSLPPITGYLLLLPYLEQSVLYNQLDFSLPTGRAALRLLEP